MQFRLFVKEKSVKKRESSHYKQLPLTMFAILGTDLKNEGHNKEGTDLEYLILLTIRDRPQIKWR